MDIKQIIKLGLAALLVILCVVFHKDITFKTRYRDDPDTKLEWWQKGYDSGVESGKTQGFIQGYVKGSSQ